MPRRKRKDITVSLFPFLSVLACVIGVLTLMITGLALGQLDNKGADPAAVDRAETYVRIKKALEIGRQKEAAFKQRIAEAEKLRNDLTAARAELARLQQTNEQLKDDAQATVNLLAEADRLFKRIETLTKELAALRARIETLKAELAKRKAPPQEAIVKVQPGGTGVGLQPTFVECAAAGVVMREGDQTTRVRRADLYTDLPFIKLLDRVALQPKGTVIFLVRPDGVATYRVAQRVARSRYCRNGKLPVPGQGAIDVSAIEKALKE